MQRMVYETSVQYPADREIIVPVYYALQFISDPGINNEAGHEFGFVSNIYSCYFRNKCIAFFCSAIHSLFHEQVQNIICFWFILPGLEYFQPYVFRHQIGIGPSNRNLDFKPFQEFLRNSIFLQVNLRFLPETDNTTRETTSQTLLLTNTHWEFGMKVNVPTEARSVNHYPTSISGTLSCHGM